MQRPLRERRERANLLDLVAEELDPQRLAAGGREDVDEPAAHRELPAVLGALDALVACERERLGQPLDAELVSRLDADRRRSGVFDRHPLGRGRCRDDDEPAAVEDVQRSCPLTDEVRRWLEAGIPADAATGKERRVLLPQEPRRSFREVTRVRVLGNENRERAAELLVQRGDDQRQRRFRNARAGRQRRGELLQALGLQKLAHEREEGGTLFDVSDHEA